MHCNGVEVFRSYLAKRNITSFVPLPHGYFSAIRICNMPQNDLQATFFFKQISTTKKLYLKLKVTSLVTRDYGVLT